MTDFTVIYDGDALTVSRVEGELANRVRKAHGATETAPVFIVEGSSQYYYSEYTADTDYDFALFVGGDFIELPLRNYSTIGALSDWLASHEK